MNEKRNGFWQNVTGSVDESESFENAAVREAIEETGLRREDILSVGMLNQQFEFHDQWNCDVIEKVFKIKVSKKWPVKIDPQEHQEYKWVNEDDIKRESVHFESNYKALHEVINEI